MEPPKGEELLQYVRENNLKDASQALVDGTDPNFQDPETGITALHIAVSIQKMVLVKMMIAFDADLTLKNRHDRTALDLAVEKGYDDIAEVIREILHLRRKLDADQPKPARPTPRSADESFLLSLDGGGIRGLVLIQSFIEMDNRRKTLYPDSEPLLKQFNCITGNSAGGIAALALGSPKVTLPEGRKLFFTFKDKVLGGEPPIPNEQVGGAFEKVYDRLYGPSAMMSDIKGLKLCVMTTLANQSPAALHIMSNYGGVRDKDTDPPEKQLIWKAARATSSVPVFFHPQDKIYMDGGLIANNPTTDAIIDMYEYAEKEKQEFNLKLVLSLGTGYQNPKDMDDIDFEPSKLGKFVGEILSHVGHHNLGLTADEVLLIFHNPKPFQELLNIVSAQITQPDGAVQKRAKFVSERVGAKYFRVNPTIKDIEAIANKNYLID